MKQERIVIQQYDSAQTSFGDLVISAGLLYSDRAEIVVGSPGLPNLNGTFRPGGALLFETSAGIFEVRLLKTRTEEVELLITQVSSTTGILGGFIDQDVSNSHFTTEELARIHESLEEIRDTIGTRPDIKPEQLDFIVRKLDEIEESSKRLGRKDWLTYLMGALTGIATNIMIPPEAGKALFQVAGKTLSWLWTGGLKMITF